MFLVLPTTFKMFRAFKAFFLAYLRWGIKDKVLAKISPRNVVSSTTGIGLVSRKSCGSKWRPLFWHTVFVFENRKPLSIAQCLFYKAAADVQLYLCWIICSKSEKSSTYNEQLQSLTNTLALHPSLVVFKSG